MTAKDVLKLKKKNNNSNNKKNVIKTTATTYLHTSMQTMTYRQTLIVENQPKRTTINSK